MPLLRDVSLDTVIELCQHAELRHLRTEEVLYQEGDPAEHFWVVLKGGCWVCGGEESGAEPVEQAL